jgi:hypothetical protein
MYFIERYMAELKGWIRQRAWLEGSMAQGYMTAETMHFISDYTQKFHSGGPRLIDPSGYHKLEGIVLPKTRKTKVMTTVFRKQA